MTKQRSRKQRRLSTVEAEKPSVELVESTHSSADTSIEVPPTIILSEPVNMQVSAETIIESTATVLSEPVSMPPANLKAEETFQSSKDTLSASARVPAAIVSTSSNTSLADSSAAARALRSPFIARVENYIRSLEDAVGHWLNYHKDYALWVWGLKAPIFVLAAMLIFPRFLLLWIVIVLAKPISLWLYRLLPLNWRERFKLAIPSTIRNSPFLNDVGEGADQGLPFILFWLYLCCAPFALLWITAHWIKGFFPSSAVPAESEAGFVFRQNSKRNSEQNENNFYYSRAFGIVVVAFFALGIPAFFSFSLYEHLGVDQMVRRSPVVPVEAAKVTTSAMLNLAGPPEVRIPRVGLATRQRLLRGPGPNDYLAPEGTDATFVTDYKGYWPFVRNLGVEPTKASTFFVHFYLVSLATALCMLFFRAWFFFPLNFLSDEHDVKFTATGIRRTSLKGWFLSVLTINRWATGGGPDSLNWQEIKCVRHLEDGFTRLCPLPETAFKKESLSYKLLNKVAAFIDGLSNRLNTGSYLVFSTTENEGDFGRNIKIDLNELNREQRARLFYCVKNWAPHVVVKKSAEEQLIGSTVLQDVRYTQLWFDLLTSKTRSKRQSALTNGETLKGGEYLVEERLCAGGQATAYLCRKASGRSCVLKEFILATSSSSGALIESAREFEAEVSLLSQLDHPAIVHLEDFFTEDGRVYVVLEYVEGQSLRQKVQQEGPLSEAQVAGITQSICDVLEYLHGFNPAIVHRDITPENIIMQSDGTIKLIDFSLAVKDNGLRTTDSCGKQAFTPPEQFRDEVTVQSDIYALGATMYFLLTGLAPKPISSSSPRTKAVHVSPEMNAVVERATQLDLSKRYESVQWLQLDLANLKAPASPPVDAPSSPQTAKVIGA